MTSTTQGRPRHTPGRRRVRQNRAVDARREQLRTTYVLLRRRFGHQRWWPGETPFEICVGAILTQNTNWGNVERAIAALKRADVLDARRLFALPPARLARLIRPSGYFNVKARRLRAFLQVLVEEFDADLSRLLGGPIAVARERLLAIPGVGPETADSMLLYAGTQPSFVIDAYTRRIAARHAWCRPDAGYEDLKRLYEDALGHRSGAARIDYWQDYHAQLVRVGKELCRPREARCDACPLKPLLPPGGIAVVGRNKPRS